MFSKNVDKVTVVFDKGNNSKDNMKLLDDTPYHFVGSLKPYDYKHFMEIPLEKFQIVPMENGEEDMKKDEEPNNDQPGAGVPLDGPEDKSACFLLCSRIDAITALETQITECWLSIEL
jgi:hypothetical protein